MKTLQDKLNKWLAQISKSRVMTNNDPASKIYRKGPHISLQEAVVALDLKIFVDWKIVARLLRDAGWAKRLILLDGKQCNRWFKVSVEDMTMPFNQPFRRWQPTKEPNQVLKQKLEVARLRLEKSQKAYDDIYNKLYPPEPKDTRTPDQIIRAVLPNMTTVDNTQPNPFDEIREAYDKRFNLQTPADETEDIFGDILEQMSKVEST